MTAALRVFGVCTTCPFLVLRATSISRLPPKPGRFSTAKPVSSSACRTACRDAPGGGGGARRGEPRDGAKRCGRPHVGVLRRREAVEVDRVGGEPQVAQHLDVGKEQRQHRVAEFQPMRAGHEQRPAGVQLRRFFLQFRVPRMKRPEVLQGKRMLLDGNEMQPLAARRVAPPGLQRDQEVEAEAEPGLEDDEAPAARPSAPAGRCRRGTRARFFSMPPLALW